MVLPQVIGVASLVFAFVTFIRTENYRRRVRIELIKTVDDSMAFHDDLIGRLTEHAPDLLKIWQGRLDSFNHEIFVHLLSLDSKAAEDWLRKTEREKKYPITRESSAEVLQLRSRKKQ
jgi:hypothetical protein